MRGQLIGELKSFLVEAKSATYASGDESMKIINDDKSTTITFKKGDWLYHDNYFGGEPFGGREVAFYKGQPIYFMGYYGWVIDSVVDANYVYKILMDALKLIPLDYPFRGPTEYTDGELLYRNNFTGEIDNFSGEEIISKNGRTIYEANYFGGFVDIR